MKTKSLLLLASILGLTVVFSGCGPDKQVTVKASPSPSTEAIKPAAKTGGKPAAKPESKLASYDSARAEAKKEGKLLMLKFEADWCGPCKDLTEAMKSDIVLVEEMKNYTVVNVDIDDPKNKEIAARFYPDSGIPFVIVLRPEDESRVTDFLGFDTASLLARELKAARDKA